MIFKIAALAILTLASLRFAIIATWTGSNKATDRFVFSMWPTLTAWLMALGVL